MIKAVDTASRILEYSQMRPEIPITGGIKLNNFKGHIKFENVSFSYPSRKDSLILKDFSLNIPPGKVIALCGQSGSGKSTIGQLIVRFFDPDSGNVTIDGYDVKNIDPSWLRKQIGYINQEPVLFATSIFENIRYGVPDATYEQVIEAAKSANCHDFISEFPKGYETKVGERGIALSGGQKQRIAISRIRINNCKERY